MNPKYTRTKQQITDKIVDITPLIIFGPRISFKKPIGFKIS